MAPKDPIAAAKRVWSLGSYVDIAPTFLPMAAHLVDAASIGPDDDILDIGCGTGNVAVTAARRGASVTGVDIIPAMLDQARQNATTAGVPDIEWREASATDLPFEDSLFDVTLSCVGHMFANPPSAAAHELRRVTRSGGTIAFTCWTVESVVPAMGRVLSNYLPRNPESPDPPFLWGDRDVVRERMVDSTISFETGTIDAPVLSPAHYWEKATTESGLFIAALETIADTELSSLRADMVDTIEGYFDEGRNTIPMDYLLTLATAD